MNVDPFRENPPGDTETEPENAEIDAVGDLVSNIFGYHGVCLSCRPTSERLLSRAQTLRNHVIEVDAGGNIRFPVCARLDELPIQDECIKLLIVDHIHQRIDARLCFADLIRTIEQSGYMLVVEHRDSLQRQLYLGLLRRRTNGLLAAQRISMLLADSGMTHVLSRPVSASPRPGRAIHALWQTIKRPFRGRVELSLYRKDRNPLTPIRQQQFANARLKNDGLASYRTSRS